MAESSMQQADTDADAANAAARDSPAHLNLTFCSRSQCEEDANYALLCDKAFIHISQSVSQSVSYSSTSVCLQADQLVSISLRLLQRVKKTGVRRGKHLNFWRGPLCFLLLLFLISYCYY